PAETPATERPKAPALFLGPLTSYVPAAGLRWMVVGELRRLANHPGLLPALEPLFPDQGLQRYEQSAGLDLRRVETALIAGFDFGVLYAARTGAASERVTAAFIERLVSGPVVRRPHPDVVRISGVVGTTPQTLVRLDDHLVAVAVGDPTPARVVEAFARRKLRRSPAALDGHALSSLPDDLAQAPLRFYAPGPFKGEWLLGARGLLAQAVAVGITGVFVDGQRVEARLVMTGDFCDDAPERLAGAWEDLAQSSLGKLLGFNHPEEPPRITRAGDDRLELSVSLGLGPMIAGLRAAVVADVWEILDMTPPTLKTE